jgi:hypothetical protein
VEQQNLRVTGAFDATVRSAHSVGICGVQPDGAMLATVSDIRTGVRVTFAVGYYRGLGAATYELPASHGTAEGYLRAVLLSRSRKQGTDSWSSSGGTLTVAEATPTTAAGQVDATLVDENNEGARLEPPVRLVGSWRCRTAAVGPSPRATR